VLPTLNEAENLAAVVARLREVAPDAAVLVVDDASTDGTARIADGLAGADPAVRVLHRRGKKGYGESLTEGFRAALDSGADVVASMDCDFSHEPAALPSLLAAIEEADVVIGSRYVPGGSVNFGLYRRSLSAAANAFVRALFGLSVYQGWSQTAGLILAMLMRLKQICNHPSQWLGDGAWNPADSGKLARLREIAEVVAARQEKVLVFTQFREVTVPLATCDSPSFFQLSKCQTSARWSINHQPTL